MSQAYADHSNVQANTPGRTSDNNPGILAQDNGGTATMLIRNECLSAYLVIVLLVLLLFVMAFLISPALAMIILCASK